MSIYLCYTISSSVQIGRFQTQRFTDNIGHFRNQFERLYNYIKRFQNRIERLHVFDVFDHVKRPFLFRKRLI